jgi:phosphoglycolate phosphatase
MVGDRMHDIVGAGENAIASVAVTYGYGSETELRAAKPTHLVHSIVELERLLSGE